MRENYFAVIMAGGIGSRFWPVSTKENPKQFHDMLGVGISLLQKTFERLKKLIPEQNILIATNQDYKELVKEHLPNISDHQIVEEPAMRNTAPCILYSSLKIHNINQDAVMIVAPSDHWIDDEAEFISKVEIAFKACEQQNILMTLGIQPTNPNTGYGYIQYEQSRKSVKKVVNFTEKPDLLTAQKFVDRGDFLWNAGIFIWSTKGILSSFDNYLPNMVNLFEKGNGYWNTAAESQFICQNYPLAENVSIDYGIMEKADNVYVLPVDCGWNDLGTWGALFEKMIKDNNNNAIVNADVYAEDSNGNMIRSEKGKKVVLKGLSNFIVVETKDCLMIIPRKDEQEIKRISTKLSS